MAEFTADQQQAFDIANSERRVRGMPDWLPEEFAEAHPAKFGKGDWHGVTAQPTPPAPAPLGSRRSAAAAARAAAEREAKG